MSVPENDPRLRDAGARDEHRNQIDPDASPDVIESQIDAKRADISRTLSQLEQRFSPNQVMDYVRDNGGEVAENLGRSFKRNPVPFIVTGIGLAWLMSTTQGGGPRDGSGGRSYRSRYYGENDYGYDDRDDYDDYGPVRAYGRDSHDRDGGADLYNPERDRYAATGSTLGGGTSDTTPYATGARSSYPTTTGSAADGGDDESLLDKARAKAAEIGDSVGDSVDSMKAGAAERRARAAQHYERMRTDARYRAENMRRGASDRYAAMRASGRSAGYRARSGMNDASEFLQEQPLVAAAVGIAVGALIGSLLPATRTEDRYMGEYADDVRGQAADAAAEQAERLKGEAARVAGDVRESAEQGIQQARQSAEENLKGAREKAEEGVHRADRKGDEKGEQAVAKADEKTTRSGGSGSTPSV